MLTRGIHDMLIYLISYDIDVIFYCKICDCLQLLPRKYLPTWIGWITQDQCLYALLFHGILLITESVKLAVLLLSLFMFAPFLFIPMHIYLWKDLHQTFNCLIQVSISFLYFHLFYDALMLFAFFVIVDSYQQQISLIFL